MKRTKFILLFIAFFWCGCQQDSMTISKQEEIQNTKREKLWMIKNVAPTTKAVAEKFKTWSPGDTIRIKFLNDPYNLQDTVKKYASQWLKYANLHFNYVDVDSDADVKIGFDYDIKSITWSTIGTDCKAIPQNTPSLNFADLDEIQNIDIQGDILRGFGHILGLGFEHKSPTSPVTFNTKAKSKLMALYDLSENDADMLLQQYSLNLTNYTVYDKNSIMVLAIPAIVLTDRGEATEFNTELSATDTMFISSLYPYPPTKSMIVSMITDSDSVGIYSITSNSSIQVNWGDGTSLQTFNPGVLIDLVNHKYNDSRPTHMIKIYGDSDAITDLDCPNIGIFMLDVKRCEKLGSLKCWMNKLTDIDLSNNTQLLSLFCQTNNINTIAVHPNIIHISCHSNPNLTRLDLRGTKLTSLWAENCGLTYLNVSNTKISQILIFDNPMVNDLSAMTNLINTLPYKQPDSGGGQLYIHNPNIEIQISTQLEAKNWETGIWPPF